MESKTIERFIHHVIRNYQHHCMHRKQIPSIEELVKYLVEEKVLVFSSMRNYVMFEDYQKEMGEYGKGEKTKIVEKLASAYKMHPSSIWLILKKEEDKLSNK